jgi:hypothetical protein
MIHVITYIEKKKRGIDYYRFDIITIYTIEFSMAKFTSDSYCGSYQDDDSGIGIDHDYPSSSDLRSSTRTQEKLIPFPIPGVTIRKRYVIRPLIKFPWDGVIERIRPATMKNSENGDFIICQTNRGPYIACRKASVPSWVTELVREIELREK